ncbi:BamA/TamA family outer membrane protein [Vibrio aestuarianus]|uniref:BamA/TamA family outer membrane protein n=1 Tax=Vibrio aestuarianus TaxID=28171 RepID=UPI00237C5B10|nr:BamA/TamA family outer membrane protein [Vibrio aestuarianus]MDE1325470.1 BamA/TamA family outer membrane protein [Vibrio aestuarianus]
MKRLRFSQVFLLASILPFASAAEVSSVTSEEKNGFDSLLEFFGSSDTVDVSKGIDWGVLPGPFSNPEQGFGIGVAAVGLYAPQGTETGNQLSTVTISGYGSTEGTFGIGVNNSTFLQQNRLKIGLVGNISKTPSKYWGIGREAAEDDNNETEHDGVFIHIEPTLSYQFIESYFLKFGFESWWVLNQSADGDVYTPSELENKSNFGLILALEFDTRDYETNPYNGRLVSLDHRWYLEHLGADYQYQELTFNYREYVNIYDENVLAFDYFVQGLSNEEYLPWFAMSQLGGDKRMRGYYSGRYRDRYQMAAQIEYRHRFSERHGAVVWGGAGNVAGHFDELFDDNWLPTYGIGYRFAFKPRVNVRLDFGFGDESTLYFNIHEAF